MALLVLAALLLAACGGSPAEQASATEAPAIEPAVSVHDQAASEGTIVVDEVTSAGPGWLVIHASADGKPGAILGFSPVGEGANEDVVVKIDESAATDQLFAMLHVDAGQVGTFEFPDGPDAPAKAGDSIVNVPFKLESQQGESAEMEETPMVAVSDQDASDGSVSIEKVIASAPGWLVIHVSADGKPGAIIGYSAVPAGHSENVEVKIDAAAATEQLFAMLHTDAGQMGTFEFPDGPDAPVKVADGIVNVPFENTASMSESGATIKLVATDLGEILADAEGRTLYLFTPDRAGESTCYGGCAAAWPPFTVESTPTVGDGLDASLVGTTMRTDGSEQVTYNGWPLYYYAADAAPGDTNGEGVNGVWFVVSAEGKAMNGDGGDLPDY